MQVIRKMKFISQQDCFKGRDANIYNLQDAALYTTSFVDTDCDQISKRNSQIFSFVSSTL